MNAIITFKEVSDFIEKESKIRPRFTTINEKTVEVSYKPGVFMPAISVNVKIEAMRQDIVCMSYECGTAASLMIAGIVAYLEDKIPSGIEVNIADKRINVYLLRFEQLKNVCEHVSLTNIAFQDQSIKMELTIL